MSKQRRPAAKMRYGVLLADGVKQSNVLRRLAKEGFVLVDARKADKGILVIEGPDLQEKMLAKFHGLLGAFAHTTKPVRSEGS